MSKPIPITNKIITFMRCARCMREKPADVSPREWAMLEVGWTEIGLQVWCKRHEVNVVHVDFEGAKHRASMAALKAEPEAS